MKTTCIFLHGDANASVWGYYGPHQISHKEHYQYDTNNAAILNIQLILVEIIQHR